MEMPTRLTWSKILFVISVMILIVGIYFFISSGDVGTTGFVVDGDLLGVEVLMGEGVEYENLVNVTRDQALNSLTEGEQIVERMTEESLPFVFMKDKLLEAERVFQQAEYADILRGNVVASVDEKLEAEDALRLVNWEDVTYDNVIVYINQIKERRDEIFVIYDSLIATKISLMVKGGLNVPITGMVSLAEGVNESTGEEVFISDSIEGVDIETKELFDEASDAFYDDREDAGDLLLELREHLEAERLESATANVLKNNLVNFVKNNWVIILMFLVVLGSIVYVIYKNIFYRNLGENIKKMKLERRVVLQLIKKVQRERFKENKISELVYKIRMKKYKNQLMIIKRRLPVLEARLQS